MFYGFFMGQEILQNYGQARSGESYRAELEVVLADFKALIGHLESSCTFETVQITNAYTQRFAFAFGPAVFNEQSETLNLAIRGASAIGRTVGIIKETKFPINLQTQVDRIVTGMETRLTDIEAYISGGGRAFSASLASRRSAGIREH